MDKAPSLPKKLEAARVPPLNLKFQVKSAIGIAQPISVVVRSAKGEEVSRSNVADEKSGFEFSEKNKGDITILSDEGFVRLEALDVSGECVAVANILIREWLSYDNGSIVVPFATAKEAAQDLKNGAHEGPSYYTSFRDCKADSSMAKGGYAIIRYQFGKLKQNEESPAVSPIVNTPVVADPPSYPKQTAAAAVNSFVIKVRVVAASGLIVEEDDRSDIFMEVFGPRPEGGKKKSTAPRIVGGVDERETHTLLNAKGLRATRTSGALRGKNNKGETKFSWPEDDFRSSGIILSQPQTDGAGQVRVHAYQGSSFLGEAVLQIADIFAGKEGNIKVKFEPRKDEPVQRVKAAGLPGGLGQALLDVVCFAISSPSPSFDALGLGYSHVRLQITRCDAIRTAEGSTTASPFVVVKSLGKEIFRTVSIASTLFPMWGGDGSCLVPADSAVKGLTLEVWDSEKTTLIGEASPSLLSVAGTAQLTLSIGGKATSAELSTMTVTWLFEKIKEKDVQREKGPTPKAAAQIEKSERPDVLVDSPIPPLEQSSSSSPQMIDSPSNLRTRSEQKLQVAQNHTEDSTAADHNTFSRVQSEASLSRKAPSVPPHFETEKEVSSLPVNFPPNNSSLLAHTAESVVTPKAQPPFVENTPNTRVPAKQDPSTLVNPLGLVNEFLKEIRPSQRGDIHGARERYAPILQNTSPQKVPITVPALLKIRGVDMEMLEAVPRPNQVRFLQAVLRDIADNLLLDPVQLSIINVGAGLLIDFKFQLTEDQARRNIMDAFVQKTLGGMLVMRHSNAAFVEQLGCPVHAVSPWIVAETAATFGEFRVTTEPTPRLEINPRFDKNRVHSLGSVPQNSKLEQTSGALLTNSREAFQSVTAPLNASWQYSQLPPHGEHQARFRPQDFPLPQPSPFDRTAQSTIGQLPSSQIRQNQSNLRHSYQPVNNPIRIPNAQQSKVPQLGIGHQYLEPNRAAYLEPSYTLGTEGVYVPQPRMVPPTGGHYQYQLQAQQQMPKSRIFHDGSYF